MARVLIADDHAAVRAGIRQFLDGESGIEAFGEAANGAEVLEALRSARWDLLLLDIHLPDRSGLDLLREIRDGHPAVRVLVVSGLPERQYALHVLRAGAAGYLPKDAEREEFVKALRTVLAGRRYASASLADQLIAQVEGGGGPAHARLSEREFQIFCKLAEGRGVSEIANGLALSVKTVSTYRSRILEKMDFRSNADITAYALRNGLIP